MRIKRLQSEIGSWQQRTFGGGREKTLSMVLHMQREVVELRAAIRRGDRAEVEKESADIFILLCGVAHRMKFDLANECAMRPIENDGAYKSPIIRDVADRVDDVEVSVKASWYGQLYSQSAFLVGALLILSAQFGFDLESAVRAKMRENKKRKWRTPDYQGVVEHER